MALAADVKDFDFEAGVLGCQLPDERLRFRVRITGVPAAGDFQSMRAAGQLKPFALLKVFQEWRTDGLGVSEGLFGLVKRSGFTQVSQSLACFFVLWKQC